MSDNKDTEKKQTVNKPSSPVPSQNDNELDDKTKEKLQVAVRAPRHVQRHNAKLIESQQKGFLNFSPMEKRIAIGAGRIGINIADGLLFSTHKVLGPVVTAGFAVYGLSNIFYNYHTGALNRLGYRMTKTDLALSVGKEVVTSVTGLAIGAAVGTLIGMSGIPVIGQLVLGTVLSVGLGLVVGTLITRYADRLFIRLQIRHRYNYPRGRRGARRRFEEILAQYEDLNVLEVSRVVQHYADYRVASGWESPNDIDYYRNADGDPRFMPVSFQHFAIVQLERRWGFLRNRTSCRRVFKALMLTHHPDRGGDTALAAQLKTDYEIYAFCCGWMGDCATLLSAEVPNENPEVHEQYDARTHRKRNAVKEFFRSLFRPATNSAMDAEDLHRFGLLSIDNKSRQTLETVEAIQNMEEGEDEELEHTLGTDGNSDEDEDYRTDSSVRRHMQVNNRLVQQASIFRVLGAIHQTYQNTAEVVTFSSLVRIYENAAGWSTLNKQVQLYNRLQCFIRFHKEIENKKNTTLSTLITPGRQRTWGTFAGRRWRRR
ncbi:hypothetical protein ADEAN_000984200 [Angomonas deanei]|uniref:DnaJ domain containing protein n=1 Tax=Angomonas deanei TaxID=59799 RepID=A0A7G2CVG6_9TRYP|nr:hypothetical protein ADEAN_000984200 [Angomonas deanei]